MSEAIFLIFPHRWFLIVATLGNKYNRWLPDKIWKKFPKRTLLSLLSEVHQSQMFPCMTSDLFIHIVKFSVTFAISHNINQRTWYKVSKNNVTVYSAIYSQIWFCHDTCPIYKSLHCRKCIVVTELSFARMPSRQYCLSMNKLLCYNWSPELVKCSQPEQYSVETQHVLPQILDHLKLLQYLNASYICRNWTFLETQNFGQYMLGLHTILLLLTTNHQFWQTIAKLNFVHFHTTTT